MVGFEFSYPGFLLGFSGGSYYQYKKLAPYVNQNWKLTTELWKVENILYQGLEPAALYYWEVTSYLSQSSP